MTYRIFGLVPAFLLLTACAGFDDALSQVGLGSQDVETLSAVTEPVATATVAPVAAADTWCNQVAGEAQRSAIQEGFDKPTQDRMALTAYRQCAALGPAR